MAGAPAGVGAPQTNAAANAYARWVRFRRFSLNGGTRFQVPGVGLSEPLLDEMFCCR